MQKQKTQIVFIVVVAVYFLFNGCLPRNEKKGWQLYAIELQNEGWSEKAAVKIAKVELGVFPVDEEYTAYKED